MVFQLLNRCIQNYYLLILFLFVAAFTPGPNNSVASYSGFNFGIKKTIPLILGVTLGLHIYVIIINFGLILVFKQYPIIQEILKFLELFF